MIKAGFSRVDITPPLGLPIAGYFRKRLAEGVLDPLELTALAFSDGESTALIVASDLIGMTMARCDEVRQIISERTGVEADHIMICCQHQHTSLNIGMKGINELKDAVYLDLLYRKYADVAQMAIADMCDATIATAEAEALKKLSFVRRYWLADGTVATNPSRRGPKPVRYCDNADNTVRVVRFKRNDKKDIAYVNFSTHADTIGGKQFSADWPGFVRRYVEEDIDDTLCICVVGCQGDTNHCDCLGTAEEKALQERGYVHTSYNFSGLCLYLAFLFR